MSPDTRNETAAPPDPHAHTHADSTPDLQTVLVVDDDPLVRKFVALFLRGAGHLILEASDGAEGLCVFKDHAADAFLLVVTDISMPGMDGMEMVEAIRKIRTDQNVLFISAHATSLIRHRIMLDQSSFLLEKPFTAQGLISTVSNLVATRSKSWTPSDSPEGARLPRIAGDTMTAGSAPQGRFRAPLGEGIAARPTTRAD